MDILNDLSGLATDQEKKYFKDIIEDFKKEAGASALETCKEVLAPYLKKIAQKKYVLLVGDEREIKFAKKEVLMLWNGVSDIGQGVTEELRNYFTEKLILALKDVVFKHLIAMAL